MPIGSLRRYVGVDISSEAIAQAEDRAATIEAPVGGDLFIAGSITDPSVLALVGKDFDVILLRETIYYIDLDELPDFVSRLCAMLSTRGLVLIRIWDRFRYAAHVNAVRKLLSVVEEITPDGKPSILMVAAPPGATHITSP